MQTHKLLALCLVAVVFVSACANQPAYTRGDGPTRQIVDFGARYGGIAAAGAGGYFAGRELGGSTEAGILGAVVGAGTAYAFNKYSDRKRQDAYNNGIQAGQEMARAEIVNEIYRREAIYGLPPEGQESNQFPQIRNVYVPTREVNGVEYKGEYQRVPVYR